MLPQPRAKPGTSLKAIETKLKIATEDEAKGLLRSLLGSHPEIMHDVLKDFQVRTKMLNVLSSGMYTSPMRPQPITHAFSTHRSCVHSLHDLL